MHHQAHTAHCPIRYQNLSRKFAQPILVLCLQRKDKAVNLAAKLKIAVDEVKALRERFTKKDDAVKQLRRRRAESAEPKTLIKEAASSQVIWVYTLISFRHCCFGHP